MRAQYIIQPFFHSPSQICQGSNALWYHSDLVVVEIQPEENMREQHITKTFFHSPSQILQGSNAFRYHCDLVVLEIQPEENMRAQYHTTFLPLTQSNSSRLQCTQVSQ